MKYKFVISDRREGCFTIYITANSLHNAYNELEIAVAENNCQDWEIEEEYEVSKT